MPGEIYGIAKGFMRSNVAHRGRLEGGVDPVSGTGRIIGAGVLQTGKSSGPGDSVSRCRRCNLLVSESQSQYSRNSEGTGESQFVSLLRVLWATPRSQIVSTSGTLD